MYRRPRSGSKKANDVRRVSALNCPFLVATELTRKVVDTIGADYVGLQFVSDDPSGEPFHQEEPERRTAIQDWYAPIKYLVDTRTELKLVVSQMDWAGNQRKADFLKSIKEVVSSFQLLGCLAPFHCDSDLMSDSSEWGDDLSVRAVSGTGIQRSLLFIRSDPRVGCERTEW